MSSLDGEFITNFVLYVNIYKHGLSDKIALDLVGQAGSE